MVALSFTPFPELFTERLYLRQLKTEDASEIFLLRSDAVVNKYLERPKATHIDEAKEFIEKINSFVKNDQSVLWAICPRDQGHLLGTICLWNFQLEKNCAEIGYELLPEFHGRGIMQEAFLKVLDFGFNTLQLQTIEAWTAAPNLNSIKILERNRFKRDFELESAIDKSTEDANRVIYSLNKYEFSLQASSL